MALRLRTRLSLWHASIVAAILALAGFGGHWALSVTIIKQLDAALVALAETEAASLQSDPAGPVRVHELAMDSAPPVFGRLDRFVQIVDLDGGVLARSVNLGTARLPVSPEALARLRAGETTFDTRSDFGEEPIRIVGFPAYGVPRAVLVAGSLDDSYAIMRAGWWLFLGMSVALLVAVALTGVVFARRALSPIDAIVEQARRIGQCNPVGRLRHPRTKDELGRLVETLNAMLARLQQGADSQRRFTANASHQLRSPLARLQAGLEVTLRRRREPFEYEEALRSSLEEVAHLSRLTGDLLTLARLDADVELGRSSAAVPLSPMIHAALGRVRRDAHRHGIELLIEAPDSQLTVKALPSAVDVVLANVLDNAIKYSLPGGTVRLRASADGGQALISVSDEGRGLSMEEAEQIFDRFARGAAADRPETPGFGLGLAISREVIERQGGRISAEPGSPCGATFNLWLPLAR